MSSASGSASPGPAPWRASFLKNVGDMASPEFNLATLHSASAAGAVSAVPRLRTVIFRGLWASLPVNPKNTADLNPPVYESDLLTLTTDARMAKVTAHFGNLSPAMRGTFRNPEPGASRKANPADDKHKLGQKVEDLHDEVARANFRVVVIVPTEVDQTDLSDAEDPRRWLYRFVGASADGQPTDDAERSNGWEKIELWP
ncbi:Zn(II)2Cys6 transcription factor protein [Colletotrichum tofieldiae]|uniref:Zn(II)2Cys6 transcription factor protein n=1 Tax=Colletotrichum tofieldiae TaxID=708197 RepID=A0A166UZI4_9PEZI|nr:Zn(II)2Cys6 transcription factor protein [Colletotrichum tofieldiae]